MFKKIVFFILTLAVLAGGAAAAFEIMLGMSGGEAADCGDPKLMLINSSHRIPDGYAPQLTELSNGQRVAEMIYPDLQRMFDDMRADGLYPFVREGYRTAEEQKAILRETVFGYIAEGLPPIEAYQRARRTVAAPENSEHRTGLAVDINADLDRCELWEMYDWLAGNAYKYGFILRYPPDKTELTGIDYEPWHYRYVGKVAAAEMFALGLCLEEFVQFTVYS